MMFFPDDFLCDTSLISTVATGLWARLLCHLHKQADHRGVMVAPLSTIARICPDLSEAEVIAALQELKWSGVAEVGSVYPESCDGCENAPKCVAKDDPIRRQKLGDDYHADDASITPDLWCVSCRRNVREEHERRQGVKRKRRHDAKKRRKGNAKGNAEHNSEATEHIPIFPDSHIKNLKKDSMSSGPSVKVQEVADEWNLIDAVKLGKVPGVSKVSAKRAKAISARLKDAFWSDHWREALAKVNQPWMMGDNDSGRTVNFDWFIRPETVLKLIEGQYGNSKERGSDVKGTPAGFDW